jgi:type II secretory pathway component PulK
MISTAHDKARRPQGSVLVIVLWIVFGLVSLTLYFAHSMTFSLRASDNRVASMEADEAIEGARRYITCVLSNVDAVGVLPDPQTYRAEAVPVGNAKFWIIGRGDTTGMATEPSFGLVDEASKINLNTADSNTMINLPRMTPQLVANIMAWRSTNTTTLSGGAESDSYTQLQPPYLCKNAPFETMDELRLIYQMDMDTLYGEDANLNGVLDPNENDGDAQPPSDNMDGILNPGLMDYCTVYSREPTTNTNGAARFNVTTFTGANTTALTALLTTNGIDAGRAQQIANNFTNQTTSPTSVLQFYLESKMTTAEFAKIEPDLRGSNVVGLININTASQTVLTCIPVWVNGQAQQVVAYRTANTNTLNTQAPTVTWITQVLSQQDAIAAGPYLTGQGYQYSADVAAIGHDGRGYRRTLFIFDMSQHVPVIIHRQDLSQLGWALGKSVRNKWLLAKQTP